MVRAYDTLDEYRHGELVAEAGDVAGFVTVYYIPPPLRLDELRFNPQTRLEFKTRLLEIDNNERSISIFPINTIGKEWQFLKPKYDKIRRITVSGATPVLFAHRNEQESREVYHRGITFGPTTPIQNQMADIDIKDSVLSSDEIREMLEELPSTLTKDYDYGLGFAMPYRFIVEAVEQLSNADEIVLSNSHNTGPDSTGRRFFLSYRDLDTMRKQLNNTTRIGQEAARVIKATEAHNFLAERLGVSPKHIELGRHGLRRLIGSAIRNDNKELSDTDQKQIINVITRNIQHVSKTNPARLSALRDDIELESLEALVTKFDEMLKEGLDELKWQEFFSANPFVLSLAFGYPVVKVQDKASVGGRKFSGTGDSFTDFLVKNSMTNNIAIVEIKKPGLKLMNAKEYRDGICSPTADLSGGVNQALDQKHKLERNFISLAYESGMTDVKPYSIHCCLLAGMIPEEEQQRKSFELFRGNSKSVEIITFDELGKKLRNILEFLRDQEVPF